MAAPGTTSPSASPGSTAGGSTSAAAKPAAAAPRPSSTPASASTPSHGHSHAHDHGSGGGFGRALAGGVIGAVLALGGAAALQYAGVLPAVAPQAASPAPTDAGDTAGPSPQALADQIEQLRGQIASIEAAGTGGTPQSATQPAVDPAQLTALDQRLAALESGANAGPEARSAAEAASQAAAAAQTTATEARDAAGAAQRQAEAAQGAAEAAQGAATEAGNTARAAQELANATAGAVRNAQDAANNAGAAAGRAQEAAEGAREEATSAIAGLETRVAAVEESNREAGVALAAAGLKAAVDRGGPFMSELETFARTGGEGASAATDRLRGFAADGVPSAQALAARWPEVERAILASEAPPSTAPVSEQIFSGLQGLVSVRPSGAAPAGETGLAASTSRLSAAVEAGNWRGWLTEWQSLPEAAKQASADYQREVEARVAADEVVGNALGSVLGGDGAAPAAPAAGQQG
ncbi:COG4223 family protein [Antarcticirhabdus aurantiaca]|uniref:Uncharacterized protein n=1 Tax=Antarcticirhabdus aurantiaca TaxID=2606717 RepID=A0ACD4NL24_9HYPH|nr:hypothetical protein [Antarcticirhabdus aurantiaca]WAJ27493.1 hypothetical protein OXU80_22020 [Jeongeuplla avenae]